MTDLSRIIAVKPIIRYPREAQVGRTYLMTIDLQPEEGFEWQYEEEEYPVYCKVDSELFSSKPIGEPVVVLHRFGGNYGEAKFLLTAALEAGQGDISVILINAWGVPFKAVELEQIQLLPIEIIQSETEFFIEREVGETGSAIPKVEEEEQKIDEITTQYASFSEEAAQQEATQHQTVEDYFLMVVFRSSLQPRNSYYATAYLLPNTSHHEAAGKYDSVIRLDSDSEQHPVNFENIPRLMESFIGEIYRRSNGSVFSLAIEYFLPYALFFRAIEQIQIPDQPFKYVIGADYLVSVRSIERLSRPELRNLLNQRFETLQQTAQYNKNACLPDTTILSTSCSDLLENAARIYANQNWLVIAINDPLPRSEKKRRNIFNILIRSGIPIALWIREDAPLRNYENDLSKLLKGPINQLPERVKRERQIASFEDMNREHFGSYLGLMYENPNRIPPDISFISLGV